MLRGQGQKLTLKVTSVRSSCILVMDARTSVMADNANQRRSFSTVIGFRRLLPRMSLLQGVFLLASVFQVIGWVCSSTFVTWLPPR
jgi:hypothetical protein